MMKKGLEIKPESKVLAVLLTTVACIILTFYVTFVMRMTTVYTHFFYIPIILAGVWYHKKAVYVALGLGAVHVLITYFSIHPLTLNEVVRAVIFIAVAYVIGFVSEKAEEEKRLRVSVEKLARIVDSSTIPTFVMNRAHKIIHWNAALELLTGVKREEVIGTDKQWMPFYPEKRPVMADFIVDEKPEREIKEKYGSKCEKSALITGAYEALDFFPSLGEKGKWLLCTATPLRETNGDLIGALETVQDITERKLAVDALRASEKQLRETRDYLNNVIESSKDAIVVIDMEGIVRAWNKGAEAYMGYTADEVIGKSNRNFFADPKEPDRIMEQVRREGAIENYRTIVLKKDGKPVYISMSAALLKDKTGVPIGTVRVSRDITKMVELEDQVKEERDKLNSIFETMADGVYVISADYKLEFMNKVLRDEFGDQVGGICYKVFHGRKEPCPLCKHPEVMKGKTVRWEWHSRRTNKTIDLIETPLKNIDGTISKLTIFRDITERRKMEEALRKSAEHLELIFRTMPSGVFTVDLEKRITSWSLGAEQLTGLKAENVAGKTCIEIWHCPTCLEKCGLYAEDTKKPIYGKECPITIEGRTFIASKSVDFLRDEEGHIIGGLETFEDVTERKRAGDALRASEKQLRETRDYLNNVIESSADAIVVIDMEGIVRAWNKGAEAYMGYTADEVIGKSNRNFFADPKEPDRIMEQVRMEGAIENYRTIVLKKDGKPVHISISAALLKDKTGLPIGTVRVSRDITKMVELEEQVKEERDKLNSIFETMTDGVSVISADYKIEYMNKVLRDDFGDIVGRNCNEIFIDETCPSSRHLEVMEGKTVRWEWHSSRMNRTYDLIETPLKNIDGTISKLTIFRDITKRKQEEKERERLFKELEVKTAEMERFVYTISHELRSPLVTIQGFAGMLRKDLEREEAEQVETDLKFIEDRVTTMEHLLKDTLETSRIGRVVNPPEDVSFGAIVRDALAQTKEQIKSSGVDVSTAKDFPTVHVDRVRIAEALVNLIENSINYRGEQPHPKIEIGYRVEDEETVFFVRDNGIGIDESLQEKVFELFYKVDKGSKGTGAGLAIVKRIIEVHNGRIWIESEKGKGCTVCFTLPTQ
jgi:PAS domain S-box-containing protein